MPVDRLKSTKVKKTNKAPAKKRVANATLADGSQIEKDHVLLWLCFETSGAMQDGQTTIDYGALGEKLGITRLSAKARYYCMRTRVQKLKAAIMSGGGLQDDTPGTEQKDENAALKDEKEEEKLAKMEEHFEHA